MLCRCTSVINYGPYRFYTTEIYRISPIVDDKKIAGKLVWVHELVEMFDCDYLRVRVIGEKKDLYVKPGYIIAARTQRTA